VNNLIGDRYIETVVAIETFNCLDDHLCGSGTDSNVDLLLNFTVRAFYRHNNIGFVGHRWVSLRILAHTATGKPARPHW
jgi:hypothetical protein